MMRLVRTVLVTSSLVLVFFVALSWLLTTTALAQNATDSFTVNFQYGTDDTPPTIPQDVLAVPVAETQIDVSWTAATDDAGVAGYRVFRDGAQVGTTVNTTFSDTGLVASTTYSYFVRAFDSSGNISTSSQAVATTTFAAVVPPPTDPDDSAESTSSATQLLPELRTFQIEAGAEAAEISFSTNQPVRYVLRYGVADVLDGNIVETATYKRDHDIVLQNLEPDTNYLYELYGTDRFGREQLLQKATFLTAPTQESDDVVNVAYFTGDVIEKDVILRWRLSEDRDAAFVRIVRNSRFFPQSPTDGEVVYEGDDVAYVDSAALQTLPRQYYTIFAYNLSGQYSSGRVLRVDKVPTAPDVVDPDEVDESVDIDTTTPPADMAEIPSSALSFMQFNQIVQPENELFTLAARAPYRIRLLASQAPQFTRHVMVTVFETADPQTFYTYVLRRDAQATHFEARLPGLRADTEYSFIVRAYTVSGEVVGVREGSIRVTQEPTSSTDTEDVWQLWLLYILMGTLLGLLLLASAQYLFEFLAGRKKLHHQ